MIDLAILSTICFAVSSLFADALPRTNVLSRYALASVGPAETFSSTNGTIVGNNGLNVINRTGDSSNRAVTFRAFNNDFFVTDNLGPLSENKAMMVNGADAAPIIGDFHVPQFDPKGAVWDAGGLVQNQSGSGMPADSLVGRETMTPEPSSIGMTLMGAGMIAFAGLLRRRERRKRGRAL